MLVANVIRVLRLLPAASILLISPVALAQDPPAKFSLKGGLKLNSTARQAISNNNVGQLNIDLFVDSVELAPGDVFTVNIDDEYKVQVSMGLASKTLVFRVYAGHGIISAEDYVVNNQMIWDSIRQGGGAVTKADVLVQTVDDRYSIESRMADEHLAAGRYADFYRLSRKTATYIASDRTDLFYGLVQQYSRGLAEALRINYPTFRDEITRIERFESAGAFTRLTNAQRAEIYTQYGRALLVSHFTPQATFGEMKLWQIVDHCFERAIANGYGNATDVYSERIASLIRAGEDDVLAASAIKTFLERIEPKGTSATSKERRAVVAALLSLVTVINRQGDRRIDLFETDKYAKYARSDFEIFDLWTTFNKNARPWEFLFPVNSEKDEGKDLRRYYDLSQKILSDVVAGGSHG